MISVGVQLSATRRVTDQEFVSLVRPVLHPATRLAHGMLGSLAEAEDAVQDAGTQGLEELWQL